jgi:hypothetical protein
MDMRVDVNKATLCRAHIINCVLVVRQHARDAAILQDLETFMATN